MSSVADFADEFAKRVANGKKSSVYVSTAHLESFLLVLAREGFTFSRKALEQITDPEHKRIIETIFFSAVAGAGAGAVVGCAVAGPPGAQVGAVVGAGLGFAAGCVAVTITAAQKEGGLQISIA